MDTTPTVERPTRVRRSRARGARMPEGAVYVGRGTRWGNPFRLHDRQTGLVRTPGILTGAAWEFEGRVSGPDTRHDFVMADDTRHVVYVRWGTNAELAELYRRALLREADASFRCAWGPGGWPGVPTVDEVRAELAGRTLACWCPLDVACHADVLLAVANDLPVSSPAGEVRP